MSAGCKRAMLVSPEFVSALNDFLIRFEAVFGEADWPTTLANLQNDARYLIDPNGTFLEPGVADESANWWNRGSLLVAYRRLQAAMGAEEFGEVTLYDCGVVTKPRPAASITPDDVI